MKRIMDTSVVVCLILVFSLYGWIKFSSPSASDRVDAEKIVKAIGRYSADMAGKKESRTDFVSLEELIARGYLSRADVTGFAGMDAKVSLKTDETQPQEVLFLVRLQDGTEVSVQGDGSVQQLTQSRLQAIRDNRR